jgi:hypothetical protein
MKVPVSPCAVILLLCSGAAQPQWRAQNAPLMTRWASQVMPDNVHREYPRPQMERPEWVTLNGLWDYAITPREATSFPKKYQGQILVPFPAESALSGVMRTVGAKNRLWYQREFRLPDSWKGKRMILHFGAVDWDCTVFINGKQIGQHVGGYDSFSFDVTQHLKAGENTVHVSVWDPTSDSFQPRGKQHSKPAGIWHTPSTGIWQTVWIEAVPQYYIRSLKITPDIDKGEVEVMVDGVGLKEFSVVATDGGREVAAVAGSGGRFTLKIEDAKLWSPQSPHLYGLRIRADQDEVTSYFGMRKISVGKDEQGITRLMLNNKPYFQHGPLDQGFWPDGLYTAPSDEALRNDIEMIKKLGFNMVRKHVKVEPDRWYYWCDRIGLLVWQDMPSGDKHVRAGKGEIVRSKDSADTFERELRLMIEGRFNHPSIVMWVAFNEGWGQFKTVKTANYIKHLDPTRLVNAASGFNDYPAGDVRDIHAYPGPSGVSPEANRAAVLGEFGGLGLPVAGHLWNAKANFGQVFSDGDSLTNGYVFLAQNLRLLAATNLSAAVYTQLTDVEGEVNGLMTYDRMLKVDEQRVAAIHRKLSLPPPQVITLIPTARQNPVFWRYTTEKPAENWMTVDFNDTWWNTDAAGFGTEASGAPVGTKWETSDIWIRKHFDLKVSGFLEPHLVLYHDEDAEVYINGQLVVAMRGASQDYVTIALDERARAALVSGRNCIAIHCKNSKGKQFIDLGLVDLIQEE